MQKLIIVRHALAIDKLDYEINRYRPLLEKWVRQAQCAASYLREQKVHPDLIVTSAAPRAYQTATHIGYTLRVPPSHIIVDSNLYRCDIQSWIDSLRYHSSYKNIMIVWHNPELLNLCNHLLTNPPKKLGKATCLVCVANGKPILSKGSFDCIDNFQP